MLDYGDWRTLRGALLCRFLGRTDVARWADTSNYDDWEERTRLIAGLIPDGSRVIEFGAGGRILEKHLSSNCHYVPADLVSRGPDTMLVDLNRPPLPSVTDQFDVAVFAGVLEYVQRIPSLLRWLAAEVPSVVASYCCAETPARSLGRLRESFTRASYGWVNSYSEADLVGIATRSGFKVERTITRTTPDGGERIFKFTRKLSV